MEETGKESGEINLKSMTLSKVFDLELQNYEDKVMEIVVEAREEAKNEENIQRIEGAWKVAAFELFPIKKGNEFKGHGLKQPDEIR
jgi:hypothetical protein